MKKTPTKVSCPNCRARRRQCQVSFPWTQLYYYECPSCGRFSSAEQIRVSEALVGRDTRLPASSLRKGA